MSTFSKLEDITIAYTHSGVFHADDVLSTAFLLDANKNIEIKRLADVGGIQENSSTLIFDIGNGRFDHHQENKKINSFGMPYSALGLLWEEFGREYLKKKGYDNIDEAHYRFKLDYIRKIDEGDNCGYKNEMEFSEYLIIKSFNPKWYERNNSEIENIQFKKAVLCAKEIWGNWMRDLYEKTQMHEEQVKIWKDATCKSHDGIVVLPKNINWREMQTEFPLQNLKIVITESLRGGYTLLAADSQVKICPNNYLEFVHQSGFMGVSKNLVFAQLAAKEIIKNTCELIC